MCLGSETMPFLCNSLFACQSRLDGIDYLANDDCVQDPKHTRENGRQEKETRVEPICEEKALV